MAQYTKVTEWEDDEVRLVKLGGVQQGPRFPKRWDGGGRSRFYETRRQVEGIYVHQSAGNDYDGVKAVERIARFLTATPRYAKDEEGNTVYLRTRKGRRPKRVGGGRGFPGHAYTFNIPTRPEVVDGKFEVYRIWDDSWVTWHSGGFHNRRGVGIVMVGSFYTRYADGFSEIKAPDPTAMVCLERLVDYLANRYNFEELNDENLLGHFDVGKRTCPGDALEDWVREKRGEDAVIPDPLPERPDRRPLRSWRQRQKALVDLGFEPGPVDGLFGYMTRAAVEGAQETYGAVADGIWGPQTERVIRLALAAL